MSLLDAMSGVTFRFHAYSHMAAAVLKSGLEDGSIPPEELGDRFPLPDQLVELIKACKVPDTSRFDLHWVQAYCLPCN